MDYLVGLHPSLIFKIKQVLVRMEAAGYPMKPCQGLRTADEQHNLWLQGRDLAHPGRIITYCDGVTAKSNHQAATDGFGHAVDCCFDDADPFGIKNPWSVYGALVKSVGLTWGGSFRTLIDLDHAELPL